MKKTSRLAQIIEEKRQLAQRNGPVNIAVNRPWLPRWALPLLCVAISGGATYALFEYVILSKVPHAMLGKWHVIEGEMEGATLEFFRDGTMIGKVNMKGKEGDIKARVEVDGQTLRSTSINPITQKAETDSQSIVTLTESQFVIEDKTGTIIKMERAP